MTRLFPFICCLFVLGSSSVFALIWNVPSLTNEQKEQSSLTSEQKEQYRSLYEKWNEEWKAKLSNASENQKKRIRSSWSKFQGAFQSLLNEQEVLNLSWPQTKLFTKSVQDFSSKWNRVNALSQSAKLKTRLPPIETSSWIGKDPQMNKQIQHALQNN